MGTDFIKAVLDGQAGLDVCKEAMSEALRGIMVQALLDQLSTEVTMLCGPRYQPAPGAAHRRAGSALGQFRLNGMEERYPDAVVQRCLVHKERNLRGCLSRKDYPELNRLMNRLRRSQGAQAAREALGDLKRFVAGKNQKALASVEEAGEELLALHLLEAPSTLQVSLLSTNAVENPIRNFRSRTRRVTRWRPQSDMTERWTAYGWNRGSNASPAIRIYRSSCDPWGGRKKIWRGLLAPSPPIRIGVTGHPIRIIK